jgi:uncharacterized protein (UPF0261 family)
VKKKVIAILGTLDTKEAEAFFLRDRIRQEGCEVLIIDVSSGPSCPTLGEIDVTQEKVALAAGTSIQEVYKMERGEASETMGRGAANIIKELYSSGKIHGAIGYGGSFGVTVVSQALKALPIGFPKFIVTTSVEGAARSIGIKDVGIISSITDLTGGKTINKLEAKILTQAAAAITGMVKAKPPKIVDKPTVVATQMGVTTPCILQCKSILEEEYEVVTFHAIGSGGRTVEALIDEGLAVGVLDITLAEISNELVGGICTAGPERLTAACKKGVPQIICPGALDMVNFWGPKTINVPEKFKDRLFYYHNPMVTLMRVNKEESIELGKIIAEKLNLSKGPTAIFIPLKGWSSYDIKGGVKTVNYQGQPTGKEWYDPEADAAFVESLEKHLDLSKPNIDLLKVDKHINDPEFAKLLATTLDEMIKGKWKSARLLRSEN